MIEEKQKWLGLGILATGIGLALYAYLRPKLAESEVSTYPSFEPGTGMPKGTQTDWSKREITDPYEGERQWVEDVVPPSAGKKRPGTPKLPGGYNP